MNKLQQKIIRAFGCSFEMLDENELCEFSENLCLMDNEALHRYLPQVLLNEINLGDRRRFFEDFVVNFLDGARMKKQPDGSMYCNQVAQKDVLAFAEKTFSSFTKDQAESIYDWLVDFAKRKNTDYCQNELSSAVHYWKNRKECSDANCNISN